MGSISLPEFRAPSFPERIFNKLFGLQVALGLALPHNYLLQVRGRKSGRVYSTPVNVLSLKGKRWLIAPRGRTQWVLNAEAQGEVTLRKAWIRRTYHLRPALSAEKPELLSAYLRRFRLTVGRYFPVPASSKPEAFIPLATHYPVFELLAKT